MSNPFDQFAVDVAAALPPGAPGAASPAAPDGSNPFASVFSDAPPIAPPAVANKPVMNNFQQPPPPMDRMGSMGGMIGQPQQQAPPPMGMQNSMGGMMGQPQQHAPPPSMGMGMGMGMQSSMGGTMGQSQQASPMPQQQPPSAANPMGMYGQPMGMRASSSSEPPSMGAPSFAAQPPPATDPFASYGQPPAPGVPPPAPPPSSPNPYGGPGVPLAVPPAMNNANPSYGAPPASMPLVGAGTNASPNPYGGTLVPIQPAMTNDPFGGTAAPSPYGNPYGAPPAAAPPPQQQHQNTGPFGDTFGVTDPSMGALVVSDQPSNPYAQSIPPQQQQQQMYPPQQEQQQQLALPPVANDPFAVFNSAPVPPPAPPVPPPANNTALVPAQAPPQQQQSEADLWGDLGFDPPPAAAAPPQGQQQQRSSVVSAAGSVHQEEKKEGDLPPGGEFYDARIFTPTLGVMFFKPQELTDSLFLNTDKSIVDALNERPVVAFIVEGSSARSAGVELGHVLLKVNGVDVKNPKEASRLIKEGPRPLPLLFYVSNTDVVVAEGEHMVKYDTKETSAPNSSKDWKPKYVVIGGIIAQPWMMNMYRSKSEYDIAVIETQARRPVSVKVKQFSLQGARIQNDWQGPQMVKYKNKLHPWKYIVGLPVARNPIKISSPNLAQLKPVHEGIRRVLLAQQRSGGGRGRSSGGGSRNAAPSSNNQNNQSAAPQRRASNNQQSSNQIVQQTQQQQYSNYSQPPPQQMQQQQQYPPQQQQYPQNTGFAPQPSGYPNGY